MKQRNGFESISANGGLLPKTVFIFMAGVAAAVPSWAATQTVTNTNDTGTGSLRAAVANAASGDTIQFSVTGTITLSSMITINTNVTIAGPGANRLTVSGNHAVELFWIPQAISASISGLTIENANASEGAISNFGTLTVSGCTISGNVGQDYGGAILNENTLTVTNSTFTNNSGFSGGAILNFGTLTMTNSTLSENRATYGGAIFSNIDPAFNSICALNVTNSTITDNVGTYGGGIYNDVDSTFTPKSVLIAGNTGGNCSLNGANNSQGYNLSDDSTCTAAFKNTGDQNSQSAGLDPKGLASNGGPTPTIALLPGSPAVDAIPPAKCTDTLGKRVTTDERGVTRPQGPGCDIGAFELLETVPFAAFSAQVELLQGRTPAFNLNARFALSAGQNLMPLSEAVTLSIGSYSVTLPTGAFRQIQIGPVTDFAYAGTVNNVLLDLQIIPLGGSGYAFQAAGGPVVVSSSASSIPVTLTIGEESGTTTVTPLILR